MLSLSPKVLNDIAVEMQRAKKLHPIWPDDLVHGAAIVAEEAGELLRAANDFNQILRHFPGEYISTSDIYKEAIHTIVTSIRLIEYLEDKVNYLPLAVTMEILAEWHESRAIMAAGQGLLTD